MVARNTFKFLNSLQLFTLSCLQRPRRKEKDEEEEEGEEGLLILLLESGERDCLRFPWGLQIHCLSMLHGLYLCAKEGG